MASSASCTNKKLYRGLTIRLGDVGINLPQVAPTLWVPQAIVMKVKMQLSVCMLHIT